jgi:hypothetical protein
MPTKLDGYNFASKKEANRYAELLLLLRNGDITELILQPRFELVVYKVKVGTYTADFQYVDRRTGRTVIEDVKGVCTEAYRLRRQLMWAIYQIRVQEV